MFKNCVNNPVHQQIWVASAVLLSTFGKGIIIGYPSCLLPALQAPDSPILTSLHEATWIASLYGICNVVGSIVSSICMDRYGRRATFIIDIIPGIASWLFIYFASNVPTLMVASTLSGVTGGGTIVLGALIIGEYTSPGLRGILLNLKTTVTFLGSMVAHILGHYFHWRTVAILALIPEVLALIMTCTWPESPPWLASRREFEKCKTNFISLRGESDETLQELEEMIGAQKARVPRYVKTNLSRKIQTLLKKFGRKDFVRPILIIMFGAILFEACGRHYFPTYAAEIVGNLTNSKVEVFYFTIGIDFIITATTTVATILIKIMKRRTLLFGSGVPAFIVLMSTCLYLYLGSNHIISENAWISFAGLLTFFILANLGCTIMTYVLIGEIFPLAHKAVGTIITGFLVAIVMSVAMKTTPYLLVSIKIYGTLSVFGVVIGLCLIVLYYIQPETKDKSLQEIENYFNNGSYNLRVNDIEVNEEIIPKNVEVSDESKC